MSGVENQENSYAEEQVETEEVRRQAMRMRIILEWMLFFAHDKAKHLYAQDNKKETPNVHCVYRRILWAGFEQAVYSALMRLQKIYPPPQDIPMPDAKTTTWQEISEYHYGDLVYKPQDDSSWYYRGKLVPWNQGEVF